MEQFRLINEQEVSQYFSKNLKALRLSMNPHVSQNMLARRLNLSRAAISRFESGERIPSVCIALNMARYFHVSVDDLLCRPLFQI